jgi:hypothetical protein
MLVICIRQMAKEGPIKRGDGTRIYIAAILRSGLDCPGMA